MSTSLSHEHYQLIPNHTHENKFSHSQWGIYRLISFSVFCYSVRLVMFYSNLHLTGQITQFQFYLCLSCCTATFYVFCLSTTLSQFRVISSTSRQSRKIQDSQTDCQVSYVEYVVHLESITKSPKLLWNLSLFPLIWVNNLFSFLSSLRLYFPVCNLEPKVIGFLVLPIKFPHWKHHFHKPSLFEYFHQFHY